MLLQLIFKDVSVVVINFEILVVENDEFSKFFTCCRYIFNKFVEQSLIEFNENCSNSRKNSIKIYCSNSVKNIINL